MTEYAALLAIISFSILLGAWSQARDNRRDAGLLAGIGAAGLAGAAAVAAL